MATDKLVDFDHVTDYISRDAALSCFHDWIDRYGHEHSADEMTEYQRIEDLPVADVRPVVLCRYCRWWTKQEKSLQGRCELAGFYPTGEWFCANGERSNCGADMRPNLDATKGDSHD